MSERLTLAALLELIDGDEEFLRQAADAGLLGDQRDLAEDVVSELLVARTLLRELEVNWPGVEIILRLRGEILATQRQVHDLLELLARAGHVRDQ